MRQDVCSVDTLQVLSVRQKERCQPPIVSEETKDSSLFKATGVPAYKSSLPGGVQTGKCPTQVGNGFGPEERLCPDHRPYSGM